MGSANGTAPVEAKPNNCYQYLRHIREIDTNNKLLSPVVVVAEERPVSKAGSPSTVATMATGVDVVDHCLPTTVRLSVTEALSDLNMNGKAVEPPSPHALRLATMPIWRWLKHGLVHRHKRRMTRTYPSTRQPPAPAQVAPASTATAPWCTVQLWGRAPVTPCPSR